MVAGARNDGVVLAEHVAREGRGEQQEVEVTVRGVVTHRLLTSELDRGQATVGIAHGHEGVVAPTAGGGRLEAADDRRVAAGDRGELTLHAGGAVDTVTVGETRVDVVVARREGAGVLVPLAVADPTHLEVDIEFTHAAVAVAGAVHRNLRIFTDTVDGRSTLVAAGVVLVVRGRLARKGAAAVGHHAGRGRGHAVVVEVFSLDREDRGADVGHTEGPRHGAVDDREVDLVGRTTRPASGRSGDSDGGDTVHRGHGRGCSSAVHLNGDVGGAEGRAGALGHLGDDGSISTSTVRSGARSATGLGRSVRLHERNTLAAQRILISLDAAVGVDEVAAQDVTGDGVELTGAELNVRATAALVPNEASRIQTVLLHIEEEGGARANAAAIAAAAGELADHHGEGEGLTRVADVQTETVVAVHVEGVEASLQVEDREDLLSEVVGAAGAARDARDARIIREVTAGDGILVVVDDTGLNVVAIGAEEGEVGHVLGADQAGDVGQTPVGVIAHALTVLRLDGLHEEALVAGVHRRGRQSEAARDAGGVDSGEGVGRIILLRTGIEADDHRVLARSEVRGRLVGKGGHATGGGLGRGNLHIVHEEGEGGLVDRGAAVSHRHHNRSGRDVVAAGTTERVDEGHGRRGGAAGGTERLHGIRSSVIDEVAS